MEILQFTTDGVLKTKSIILNIKEQILQQAITILLEMIYEKYQGIFGKSVSFKKTTNCHAVLHQIKYTWFCLPYYIQIKLGQVFTKTHCHILVNILKKKISDKRFIDLISAMYNNFLLCPEGFFFKLKSNKLQNNSLSFILCNIFLLDFDEYIKYKLTNFFSKNVNKLNDHVDLLFPFHVKYHKKMRNTKFNTSFFNLNFLKTTDNLSLKYVRYLDNCLFGLNGSYNLVFKIKQYIEKFLGSNYQLKFTIDTIKIINTYTNKVKFLGVLIFNKKLETLLIKKNVFLKNIINKQKKTILQHNHIIKGIKLDLRQNLVSILNQKNKLYKSKLKDLINTMTPSVWSDKNLLVPFKKITSMASNYLFFFKSLYRILMQYLWSFDLCRIDSSFYIYLNLQPVKGFRYYFGRHFILEIANSVTLGKLTSVSFNFHKNFTSIMS